MAEEQKVRTASEQTETAPSGTGPLNTGSPEQGPEAPDTERPEQETELQAQLSALTEKQASLQKELREAQKDMTKERDRLLRQKREEISGTFDKQLKALDGEIRSVNDKRQKARSQGVKARIAEQTASLHTENKELSRRSGNLFRDRHVPLIARTGFFYALIMPRGIKEILTAAVSFLVSFGLLPVAVHALIPKPAPWHWAVIYFAVIVVFGGIYVSLNNIKTKYLDTVREGRRLRDQVRANDRQIRKIAGEIRRDRNDKLYDLGMFDDMLAQKSQERADVERRRSEALEQFDAVTRNVLADEVAAKYEEHFSTLDRSLSDLNTKIKELEEKMRVYGKTADDKGNL